MGNNFQDWDDEDDDFLEDEPRQRKQDDDNVLRQVRKAAKAAEKRAKELEAELSTLRAEQRKNLLSNFLTDKGLNPKIAKFLPTDMELSADSLNTWLDEYGDVFGLKPVGEPSDLSALRQIDQVTSTAQIPAGADDVLNRLNQASSAEEIISMIYSTNQ